MTLMIDRESEPSAVIDRKSEPSAAARLDSSYVDWEAIVGGAVVAVVIFTTLTAFGSAVGTFADVGGTGARDIGKARRNRNCPLDGMDGNIELRRRRLYFGSPEASNCCRARSRGADT